MKRYIHVLILILLIFISGCSEVTPVEDNTEKCDHINTSWVWEEDAKCNKTNIMNLKCDECGEIIDQKEEFKDHEYECTVIEATCLTGGYTIKKCKNCASEFKTDYVNAKGHNVVYTIEKEATDTEFGIKSKSCSDCDYTEESFEYVNNGFSTHGALHVTGIDLMDSHNKKVRLAGVSTFGLQWQPEYVNYETFENLKNEFGANVVRLAMYTGEGGYCSSEAMKQKMYDTVVKGINIATELDMYVIVDWHMLGVDEGDNNPLTHLEESKEFFDKITKQFKTSKNILFEIMNEPCYVDWADCKKYALEVIPVIRKNIPWAIVLVGNPAWSSDLDSVAKDPIVGYSNIMYTFHFYANDNALTNKITTACTTNKLPVFVTEHGGMDASGYGDINYKALKQWYTVLDKYNISMVAWSLSNLDSSSCMFKTGSKNLSDFSDSNLKDWGIYYKNRVREMMGLPYEYKDYMIVK